MQRIDFLVPLSHVAGRPEMVQIIAQGLADTFGGCFAMLATIDAMDDTVAEHDTIVFRVLVYGDRRHDVEFAAEVIRTLLGLRSIKVGIDDDIEEM